MDKWSFGITMMVVGVAGTFATMGILILAISAFKKFFPVPQESKPDLASAGGKK
jgi:Na+-transporting methylmalonyl-CoA/oxaloacetate decarboxylase gamma subunit